MANYKYLTTTSQVKVGAGKIKGIFVSSTTGGTIAVYDEDQGGTTRVLLGVFTPAAATMYPFSGDDTGVFFTKGLNIVVANTIAFTVFYE